MKKQVGTCPVNLLFDRSTILMLLMLHNDAGRYPEMILLEATRTSKFVNTELMLVGSCPTKWLLEMLIISRADCVVTLDLLILLVNYLQCSDKQESLCLQRSNWEHFLSGYCETNQAFADDVACLGNLVPQ